MSDFFTGLDRTPGSSQLHRWADWAELLCFASDDGRLTLPELAARIRERKDDLPFEASQNQEEGVDGVDALVDALIPEAMTVQGDDIDQDAELKGKFENAVRNRADDVLKYLVQRQARYLDAYPFEVDSQARTIVRRDASETKDLYIYLLICSSLKYVNDGAVRGEFAFGFEYLSTAAAKNYLPEDAVVRHFGSNPHFPNAHYSGLLLDKAKKLASELDLVLIAREKDFAAHNYGDGGLDIVAWMPVGDQLPGIPVFLAQCACTEEWVSKQHSASPDQWESLIHFKVRSVTWTFIPFDFRDLEDDWYSRTMIHNSVLFDRYRLIHLLSNVGDSYNSLRASTDLGALDATGSVARGRAQELADI